LFWKWACGPIQPCAAPNLIGCYWEHYFEKCQVDWKNEMQVANFWSYFPVPGQRECRVESAWRREETGGLPGGLECQTDSRRQGAEIQEQPVAHAHKFRAIEGAITALVLVVPE
jgi:hypothetical protein